MQSPHESPPRGRSAFAAAFLSLLFPGLGHAYLGAYRRGLAFATPPILLLALTAGLVVRLDAIALAGLAVQDWFLAGVFVANVIALVYRAVAIVDAWRIARWLDRGVATALAGGRAATPTPAAAAAGRLTPVIGLAAVLLVMSGLHLVVARYDLLAARTASCIFDPEGGCIPEGSPDPSPSSGPEASPAESIPAGEPTTSIPPWDGKERLNVLLLGADEQGGGHNTDTMIVVSIDPATGQSVMFSLPRDTVDVPVPPGPLRSLFGQVYGGKINSFYANTRNSTRLPDELKGYNGLMAVLGHLYGLDIRYYVEVNFDGFRQVVDALGGVTVNVQIPVVDDRFPGTDGSLRRLYIPAGMQRMDGTEALRYARSRHTSSDFDRAARQQRILVSLRRQTDLGRILPVIDELAAALATSVRTNVPRPMVPQLLGLAQRVDTRTIRSVIFTPPYYQVETLDGPRGYTIQPRVERIRRGVIDALTLDPGFVERRDGLAVEAATVWVLNGSSRQGEAARLAAYLEYLGVAATAPGQKPDVNGLAGTTIRAYNGAELEFPLTFALLEEVLGAKVVAVDDPAIRVDFVVITGKATPQLTPPPLP